MTAWARHIATWEDELDRVTMGFTRDFGHLPVSVLRKAPTPREWSVAQNIHHLILVNSSYFEIFSKVTAGAYRPPAVARFPFLPKMMGEGMIAVQTNHRGIKTFKIWRPDPAKALPDPIGNFQEHQKTFKHHLQSSAHVLDRNPVIASPTSRLLAYPLMDVFAFLIAHENRHLEQARRALRQV